MLVHMFFYHQIHRFHRFFHQKNPTALTAASLRSTSFTRQLPAMRPGAGPAVSGAPVEDVDDPRFRDDFFECIKAIEHT